MSALLAVGDPLLSGDIGLAEVLIVLLKVVAAFVFLMVAVMFMVWFERKVIAGMQNRVGPNKAGPWGILQTLADGIKLFFKEDLLPEQADRFVFKLAPYLSLVPAFLVFCVIPIAGDFGGDSTGVVTWFGHETLVQLADPPVGILFVLAMSSIAVYGVMLAGWSSGSKYPLLGSVRASAQMVSYEAALGLSVATVVLVSGTLSTTGIVDVQGSLGSWSLVTTGIVPFIVFVIAATAELNRPPFDLVEAEQELVGGFHTEYSSIRFALFFLAEFMNTVTMSAVIVTLFLGGPQAPAEFLRFDRLGWLQGMFWFFLKLFVFLFMYVWFRATLPRLRYDQLMDLGWKILIPVAFGWMLVITALRVAADQDWDTLLVSAAATVVAVVSYLLFMAALRVAARNRALEGTAF
ncbi:MAG TPA: NADH-quinone oxidoreductase subunit NuoH [Acidimicrobiales bacterium]